MSFCSRNCDRNFLSQQQNDSILLASDRRWLTEFSHHAKLKYIVVAYITYIRVGISGNIATG
ncbi:MAG: hypothetical protein HC903_10600 [Methylacidiphilales bacterium]|nr:hypothetical protein [Candidatus Methylacidiphilales bacterium]NJR17434.1 hypothetical protein [Calothrix sp. CSU_2_0]